MAGTARFRDSFQESFDSLRAVDRASGVVRGAKILGYDSLHGRGYTDGAMANGARLYEGAVGYLNHAGGQSGRKRSVQDAFCVYHNPEFRPGQGIFADVHLIHPKGEFEQRFLAAADSSDPAMRRAFSFSPDHVVTGKPAQKGGRQTVESIDHVSSVDLVPRGATTKGIFEGYDMVPPPALEHDGDGPGMKDGKGHEHHIANAMHCIATHPSMHPDVKNSKTKHLMKALHGTSLDEPLGPTPTEAVGPSSKEQPGDLSEEEHKEARKRGDKYTAEDDDIGLGDEDDRKKEKGQGKGGTFKEGIDVDPEQRKELDRLRFRERVREAADELGVSVTKDFLDQAQQAGWDATFKALAKRVRTNKAREAARPQSIDYGQQRAQEGDEPKNAQEFLLRWAPGAAKRMVTQ